MADPKRLGTLSISAVGVLRRHPAGFLEMLIAFKTKAARKAAECRRREARFAGDVAHRAKRHFDGIGGDIVGRLAKLRRQAAGLPFNDFNDVHHCVS